MDVYNWASQAVERGLQTNMSRLKLKSLSRHEEQLFADSEVEIPKFDQEKLDLALRTAVKYTHKVLRLFQEIKNGTRENLVITYEGHTEEKGISAQRHFHSYQIRGLGYMSFDQLISMLSPSVLLRKKDAGEPNDLFEYVHFKHLPVELEISCPTGYARICVMVTKGKWGPCYIVKTDWPDMDWTYHKTTRQLKERLSQILYWAAKGNPKLFK